MCDEWDAGIHPASVRRIGFAPGRFQKPLFRHMIGKEWSSDMSFRYRKTTAPAVADPAVASPAQPSAEEALWEAGIDKERVILDVRDLVRQYEQSDEVITAVNRVTFKVKKGEFVAIVGASGSGKSTLLHMLAGLDRPNAGSILVRGQDITAMGPDELSRFRGNYLGMIFQSHNLIPQFTALENILIPTMMCRKPDSAYEENLKKLVVSLGIADRLHHLPSELSGGQQQRVAIARALINMPHIVFADEPTGNLDRANADEVLRLLLETRRMLGQTLIMVTHDMSIAEQADRLYRMDNGRLEQCNRRSARLAEEEGLGGQEQ